MTLLHEMKRRDAKRGLATLCIGGGQGIAMVVENGDLASVWPKLTSLSISSSAG